MSPLLKRHSVSAGVFFSGAMCGRADYPLDGAFGHIHLVRRGPLRVSKNGEAPVEISKPSLLVFMRPVAHTIEADERVGADLVCARLSFAGAQSNPLLLGFPDQLIVPLDALDGLEPLVTHLFDEAFAMRNGHRAAVDLLVELLLILLLRHCIATRLLDEGLLAGLADPRLARVLAAIDQAPQADWSVEALADKAGMSRANFAAIFKTKLGVSPGDYVSMVRLAIARQLLQAGRPLKLVTADVGYASTTALSRAFQRRFGQTPRDWIAQCRS